MTIERTPNGSSVPEGSQFFGLRAKRALIRFCQSVEGQRSRLLINIEERRAGWQLEREEGRGRRLSDTIELARQKAAEYTEETPEHLSQNQEELSRLLEDSQAIGERIEIGATQLGELSGETISVMTKFIWRVGSGVGQAIRVGIENLVKMLQDLRSKKNG